MFQYRLRTLLLMITLIAVALCAWNYRDAIPGTFHLNKNGFPRGTGSAEVFYDKGALMIREWYFRGLLYKATWFRPDGSEIATETYDKSTGGVGYYLRQDGTIKSRYVYEYLPEEHIYGSAGAPTYYDLQGNPVPDATEPIE